MPDPFEKIQLKYFAKLPYLILTATLLITIGVTYKFYRDETLKNQTKFDNETRRLTLAIEDNLKQNIFLVQGLRAFIESEKTLNRQKLDDYVEGLELDKNFRGIQGIGYSKIFNSFEGESLTEKLREEGYTNFNQLPNEEKIVHQATIYLKPPVNSNVTNQKYDISNEPLRQAAFERAKDTGRVSASEKIALSNGISEDKRTGFLIYLPIYKPMDLSVLENRKIINGFIYTAFSADEFLQGIMEKTFAENIRVRVFDGQENVENLLSQTPQNKNEFGGIFSGTFEKNEEIDFAGRRWILKFQTLSGFSSDSGVGWTPFIFFSGIGLSLLLFGITFLEASSREKLEKTTDTLLELEKQKQDLFEKEQKSRLIAESANLAKGEFISLVSHELRTPLNAIAGWTKIIRAENLSPDTKIIALAKIEKNLRTQTKLVEDLLGYSQIISGEITFEKEEVNFSALFEGICSKFEPLVREKNIQLIKENHLSGQMILGNWEFLKIVIQNLFTNAVKFTNSGGKIKVKVKAESEMIKMTISDDGEGIKPEYLPRIFEIFSQADASTTRNHGGLGLGLSISNHIINLHNGTIEAESEGLGKGSVFTVNIPCKKD